MLRHYLLTGYRLIMLQLILLGIVAGIFAVIGGWRDCFSSLLGGNAWILPSLYFVHKLFKPKKNYNPQTILKDFLLGEGLKILLSAGLIILTVLLFKIKIWAFFSGYIATVAAIFLTPFWYRKK